MAKSTKSAPIASKREIRRTATTVAKKSANKVTWEFPLSRMNLIIAGIGILVIITGFLAMATGITNEPAVESGKWNNPIAITVGPVLLVIGYCIIIPFAIMKFFGKKPEETIES